MTQRDSGLILDGKYEILERLATGGMGEVWRARHIHLQELRVIKILRADRATDPQALQRFAQEARISTQIKHPNVAILYDFSRLEDGSFYMVWEHIDGEDVGAWLRNRGVFPVRLAIELGIQALRGLDAIHSAGVIHRDLSPDNLMITRDRRDRPLVKIIDLGLAKNLHANSSLEITQAGMFMGKLMYCSPEQAGSIQEQALDHRSDLYSFSAVLYEMVSGRTPFDSENPHGYVLKRLTEKPAALVGRNSQVVVPPALDRVVLRGLEKDREKRWPDAISFLRALVDVAEQQRGVATQEVRVQSLGGDEAAPLPSSSARRRAPELSREERVELLAQIEAAAKKVSEATKMQELTIAAIQSGRIDEALQHLNQLEAKAPHHASLADLKARLASASGAPRPTPAAAPASAPSAAAPPAPAAAPPAPAPTPAVVDPQVALAADAQRARVAEAEKLLTNYIAQRKQSLAAFALDTLLELAPDHPRRAEFAASVGGLGEQAERLRSAEEAAEACRQAIARGDFSAARDQLTAVERGDPSHTLGSKLARELEVAEARNREEAEVERRRDRLEDLIESRRLSDAQKELERLAGTGLAKISIETYRLRIADIAALAELDSRSQQLEVRYRQRIDTSDWMGAREVAMEFGKTVPDSKRPAELLSEIARLEDVYRRQRGIEECAEQLDRFLAQGKASDATMALRILVQMAPEHPRRSEFERRVGELGRGGG